MALPPHKRTKAATARAEHSGAVVTYNGEQANNQSPYELIMHESMRRVLSEVDELRKRCEDLEQKSREDEKAIETLQDFVTHHTCASTSGGHNVSGYAESDASTSDEIHDANTSIIEQRFRAIGEILATYDLRLQDHAARQNILETQTQSLVTYKNESAALFGALRKQLDGIDGEESRQVKPSHAEGSTQDSGIVNYLVEKLDVCDRKIEKLTGKLNLLEMGTLENKQELDGMSERMSTIAAAVESSPLHGHYGSAASEFLTNGNSTSSNTTADEQTQQQLTNFKNFIKYHISRTQMEQHIDDAVSREDLHTMYHQIDSILLGDDEHERRRCGPFKGNTSELWPLRHRVISRLALLELYNKAFDEAKTSEMPDWMRAGNKFTSRWQL